LNPGSPAAMAGTLTTEPLRELVVAADQAYLIITVSYWPCALEVCTGRAARRPGPSAVPPGRSGLTAVTTSFSFIPTSLHITEAQLRLVFD